MRRSGTPRPRRLLRWLVGVCVTAMVAALAGWPVYVRPQTDSLRHADAIFILGGPTYGRYPFGMDLARQGWAPTVVASNPNGPYDPWLSKICTTPPDGLRLQCFIPDPGTTKGEARELRRLAKQNGWRTVIVVTFRPHISRARHILQECFDGNIVMVSSPAHISPLMWTYQYLYQTAGYLRSLLQPGC